MSDELAHDFSPLFKIYKDGRIERLMGTDTVPPSVHPQTGVESKDVMISNETGLYARLYIPKSTTTSSTKLPLLVYFHGGGFCVETTSSPTYHNYLNSLVVEANVVAVSVDSRRVPEYPLPVAYNDSWDALKWVASHSDGSGSEEWLNNHADFQKLFFSGDSSGGNIVHNMAVKVGSEGLVGVKLIGIVLVHPFLWGKEPIRGESTMPAVQREYLDSMWRFVYPLTSGSDDPLLNPGKDPKLGGLGCEKVLVCVAENDTLKHRNWYYSEVLRKSGWKGAVEVLEAKGEGGHVFHLFNPTCDSAQAMLKKITSFIN
ncbi:probable carboxylesterase 12 [Rosa rugosa]|uniref:probable carboxylesterase 12 n=1 Tax=Rosa rugosa TaxID=74645 RepID=UPI002B40E257|nr:probable carboxylesterase 12 [Rosa rugosa]XP_062019913.1 probable carboxylesterase 12 [Rosa rugosa]XP_062019914.1 probable carboxylesterase 12 [Rosa rugosa]XP_062019915.1 probable carboxylesterase 12 [Rosa rugosa]XP_062019916.1 probable carboxylesterase 12 [Rosa rugosa]XP_062019917.1 probable carboxylesterase 12 [Rosa rugosa]XP_062019918.1 probable carboxylesterase 12 [Rosa rugosa]XP_062019919.1 probable carboxylesterase 12 [Rosa rugosa]